jgi:hypothetical protein
MWVVRAIWETIKWLLGIENKKLLEPPAPLPDIDKIVSKMSWKERQEFQSREAYIRRKTKEIFSQGVSDEQMP